MAQTEIRTICDRFRSELRRLLLQWACARLVIVALLLLTLLVGLDWYLRFGVAGRAISLAAFVGALAFVFIRELLRPLRRRWTDKEVLCYLDAVDPQHRDALTNLYEMDNPENVGERVTPEGQAILAHARAQLAPVLASVQLRGSLEQQQVRRWRRIAGGLVLAAVLFCVPFHQQARIGLARLFVPFANIRWSTLTTLEVVEPETGWLIPQGENFELVTKVIGQRPLELELIFKSRSTDYWITEHVAVNDNGTALYTFRDVAEPVKFYLQGGDEQTDRYSLEVIEKPRIKGITAYYEYPPYAQLPNQKTSSGQVRGLEGTKVRLEFESTTALRAASFAFDGKQDETLPLTTPTTFAREFVLQDSGRYVVKLTDEHGFREYRPEGYGIQVIPDNPPEVKLLSPGRDLVATSQAELAFAFEVKDDFGLTAVKFMHALDQAAGALLLTDHITGPVPQTGKDSRGQFNWDFQKLEVKGNATIEYYVVAADCNPTGRGTTESTHYRINLMRPTDFHLQILYEARKILMEARLAFRNQKSSYLKSQDWIKQYASGKPDDEKWKEILDLQESSHRAAQALGRWLSELDEHIQRNRMQDDFMKTRLVGIEDLWRTASGQVAQLQGALAKTHPRTAADAENERLKATRARALQDGKLMQETAVVALGQLQRKMFDWENLQTALVNTKLLQEREGEICGITRQLAPQTIGKEIEDLDDKLQDKVLTLGQQQASATDAETTLESDLARLAGLAETEGRKVTKHHLLLALGFLRDKKLNQTLKLVVEKIKNNQLSDVINDQMVAESSLKIIQGLLVKAGKDVREEPIQVAALLAPDKDDVESVKVKLPTDSAEEDSGVAYSEDAVKKMISEVVPLGDDALSQSLLTLAEQQDRVKSRTNYLGDNVKADDMPRYKKLKLGMLCWRQNEVKNYAREKIQPLIEKSEYSKLMQTQFGALYTQIDYVQQLLKTAVLSTPNQKLQEDIIETSRDNAQFIARQKQIKDMAAEHAQKGGKDEFDRPYAVKDQDLKKAVDVYQELDWNRTLQASISRKSEWLRLLKTKDSKTTLVPSAVFDQVQEETGKKQEQVAADVGGVKKTDTEFSPELKERLQQTGVGELPEGDLGDAAKRILRGQVDDALRQTQDQAESKMSAVLTNLKALMDERQAVQEKKPETPAPPDQAVEKAANPDNKLAAKVYLTEEDVIKEMTPAAIKRSLAGSTKLPEDIKTRLQETVPATFPSKYGRLVGAYYRTLLDQDEPAAKKGESAP